MSRYIDLDEAKARTTQLVHGYEVEQWLETIPSINIDRPQGEWIETSEGTMCSNCYKFPYDDGEYHIANWHSDYCPNCGARMKGADDE